MCERARESGACRAGDAWLSDWRPVKLSRGEAPAVDFDQS